MSGTGTEKHFAKKKKEIVLCSAKLGITDGLFLFFWFCACVAELDSHSVPVEGLDALPPWKHLVAGSVHVQTWWHVVCVPNAWLH